MKTAAAYPVEFSKDSRQNKEEDLLLGVTRCTQKDGWPEIEAEDGKLESHILEADAEAEEGRIDLERAVARG